MHQTIPLLTDIIETGDQEKAGLHQKNDTKVHLLNDDEEALSQKIEHAIDSALPAIKRQLHHQILSSLLKK
ncbi:MAG: hypothetical protein OEY11_09595 [Gammaproteobacteria bacterium]|nr:hypothetical protein [Gammaproteobacteria bacterium]